MNGVLWTKAFWQDTAERVISTAAQATGALIPVSAVSDKVTFSLQTALLTAAFAAVASLLKCVGATRVADADSPSLITTEKTDL